MKAKSVSRACDIAAWRAITSYTPAPKTLSKLVQLSRHVRRVLSVIVAAEPRTRSMLAAWQFVWWIDGEYFPGKLVNSTFPFWTFWTIYISPAMRILPLLSMPNQSALIPAKPQRLKRKSLLPSVLHAWFGGFQQGFFCRKVEKAWMPPPTTTTQEFLVNLLQPRQKPKPSTICHM